MADASAGGAGRRRRAALLALSLAAAACTPFRFEAEEVRVRHDREADALELSLVYEGLHARSPREDGLRDALDAVRRMAAGERLFVLVDWPLVIDLDAADPELEVEIEELTPELAERARALAASLRVDEVELFEDGDGRLGCRQRLRLDGARAGVDTLNALVNAALAAIEVGEGAEIEVDGWDVDARTRELMLAHARRGDPWLALAEGGFEVRIPLSRRQAAQALRALAPVATPGDDARRPDVSGLFGALTEVDFAGELLVLRFLPDGTGAVRFRFERHEWRYDDALRRALLEEGVELERR